MLESEARATFELACLRSGCGAADPTIGPFVGVELAELATSNSRRAVVRSYNKPGTAEQWIKEAKQAVKLPRLSCHRFRSNQVRHD
jgi:hypothetical protein